jgi:ketosteroid isomerase-like protein
MSPTTATPGTEAPPLSHEDRTAIDTYFLRLEQLQRSNDWRGLLALMAENCVTMPPRHSAMEGHQAWLQWVQDRDFRVTDLTIDPLEYDGSGDLAFVRCNYRWTYSVKGRTDPVADSGKFLGILRKQPDDRWLATHWMWNSNTRR